MFSDALVFGCGMLAVVGWLLAGIGWARYFNRQRLEDKRAVLQELALVMSFTSLMTAATLAFIGLTVFR